jgi:hypothetical protein
MNYLVNRNILFVHFGFFFVVVVVSHDREILTFNTIFIDAIFEYLDLDDSQTIDAGELLWYEKNSNGISFLLLLCFEIFVCCSALNIFCAGDADDKVKVCFAAFGKVFILNCNGFC